MAGKKARRNAGRIRYERPALRRHGKLSQVTEGVTPPVTAGRPVD